MKKYATLEVLSASMAGQDTPLMRTAHRAVFDYSPQPGFLYVRSRAISSRTNDNYDTFPAAEIEKGWRTFIGKPVFVNHENSNHRRARGVIVDAVLHKDSNKDGSPDTWVEVLMEVDAVNFPKLAEAIVKGEIERTSMGTDVEYSLCSFCGNKAATPAEYCRHIPKLKGRRIRRTTASGNTEDVLVSEICYGLKFFENSLLVEEPADPTAFFLGIDTRGLTTAAIEDESPEYQKGYVKGFDGDSEEGQGEYAKGFQAGDAEYAKSSAREDSSVLRSESSIPGTSNVGTGELRSVRMPVQPHAGVTAHRSSGSGGRRGLHRNDQEGARMSFGGKRVTAAHKTARERNCPKCDTETERLFNDDEFYSHCPWCGWTGDHLPHKSKKLGYGEVVAPPQVDTLAPTNCPICGTEEGFNGDECAVCGYLKPPEMFMDPDLEMAQQTDLRQDQKDQNLAGDMLEQSDPDALLECDLCGHAVPDADGVTPAVDGAPAEAAPGTPPASPQPPSAPAGAAPAQPPNTPGTTPLNPAQDAQAPAPAPQPPGAELGDVPAPPPDPAGSQPAPKPDEHKDQDTPPAGKDLPKKAPSAHEDAGDDPATNPNAVDAAPDSDPDKPTSQKGDDAVDAKTDDKGNPFAKTDDKGVSQDSEKPTSDGPPGFGKSDDSADSGKGLPETDKKNPDGSDPKDLPPAHEGDPCPSCGTGKLTKSEADQFNADEAVIESGDMTPEEVAASAEADDQAAYPGDDDSNSGDDDQKKNKSSDDDSNPFAKKDDDPKKPKPSPTDDKSKQGVRLHNAAPPEGVSSMAARPAMQVMQEQQEEIKRLAAQNAWLYKAVNRLATVAGLRVEADEANPANPVPSPGAEAPYSTLQQERDSGTQGDVAAIGGVPGATDVAADATDVVDSIGGVKADTPYNVSEDVTKPTDGTDGHRPLDEVRTVPEIQFGNPLKPDAAFPLQGEWSGRATVGSAARTFAALRLARLRIEAGIEDGDDTVIAQRIEADASLPDAVLDYEASTLASVLKSNASKRPAPAQPQRRQAAARAVPSVAASAPAPSLGSTTASGPGSDEFAFE